MGKVTLNSGTSTGLGFNLALQLSAQEYIVYTTMSNLTKAGFLKERTGNRGNLRVLALDVLSIEGVQRCVETVVREQGRIDNLVTNTGAGSVKTTEMASDEETPTDNGCELPWVVPSTKAVLSYKCCSARWYPL
ncbi:SDR family NAD(P)-dependent oxidoreductase [Microbulbifer sp. MLAF003]|uniref:SDR family NAD(P)-dependent oxidoreductase n=1 Tax=Microbulbifer sp. MLAF003 TaxID=3032582 RepID=UPI0024AD2F46|nr:SDR family NAD(P)-dependent oxidoreductase [Microbulbifer sp. MLAF003]WHI51843.1 SDR family NAD(P)-dependent oxidoreductase [Microbulbifer sp. MLAF003]